MRLHNRERIWRIPFVLTVHPPTISVFQQRMYDFLITKVWLISVFDTKEFPVKMNDIRHDLSNCCRIGISERIPDCSPRPSHCLLICTECLQLHQSLFHWCLLCPKFQGSLQNMLGDSCVPALLEMTLRYR